MDSTAIRCTGCGKIRKDIYNNKVAGYILSFIAMIFVLTGLFTEGTTSIVFSVIGLLFAAGSFYFYSKVSKLLKSWWWI
ncbi:MAG: hypothetical protein B6D37_14795 [Sphingobacteriales bacterium UTBCD1]|nr:MAG: hypothetical protein B6D37_14795 [Sphingobacteriales bacterium UTBCD1]